MKGIKTNSKAYFSHLRPSPSESLLMSVSARASRRIRAKQRATPHTHLHPPPGPIPHYPPGRIFCYASSTQLTPHMHFIFFLLESSQPGILGSDIYDIMTFSLMMDSTWFLDLIYRESKFLLIHNIFHLSCFLFQFHLFILAVLLLSLLSKFGFFSKTFSLLKEVVYSWLIRPINCIKVWGGAWTTDVFFVDELTFLKLMYIWKYEPRSRV